MFLALDFGGSLNLLADIEDEVGESLEGDIFAGIDGPKDMVDCGFDSCHDVLAAAVQQPPAEGEVLSVGIKVVAVDVVVVVVVVLEGDAGALGGGWRGGERHDRG